MRCVDQNFWIPCPQVFTEQNLHSCCRFTNRAYNMAFKGKRYPGQFPEGNSPSMSLLEYKSRQSCQFALDTATLGELGKNLPALAALRSMPSVCHSAFPTGDDFILEVDNLRGSEIHPRSSNAIFLLENFRLCDIGSPNRSGLQVPEGKDSVVLIEAKKFVRS